MKIKDYKETFKTLPLGTEVSLYNSQCHEDKLVAKVCVGGIKVRYIGFDGISKKKDNFGSLWTWVDSWEDSPLMITVTIEGFEV